METPDARRALLAGLIDHAPTFPPASLPVREALAEDEQAVESPSAWVLARLVWPASRLAEIRPSGRAVSAVLDAALPPDAAVEAVEARFGEDISHLPGLAAEVYVEVPVGEGLEEQLDVVSAHGLRAKVRCGGAAVPGTEELAHFVRACRERGLVFKATAGLHHAVRSNGEHGVLNLLAAVVFEGDEASALTETVPAAFSLDADAFTWRGRRATGAELEQVRRELFHSIGSCSFFEPLEELEALGVLPA
jgi:hypothetical protein